MTIQTELRTFQWPHKMYCSSRTGFMISLIFAVYTLFVLTQTHAQKSPIPNLDTKPGLGPAPQPKPKPDTEPKPEPKPELQPGQKPEPKVEPKPEPKPELQPGQKPEPKVEPKPEPKQELQPGQKPEPKVEPKPEPKPELQPGQKPEPKVEPKPEPKQELQPGQKPEPKVEPKPAPKPEPKPDPDEEPEPQPAPKTEPKPKPDPKEEPKPKPEPKVQPKPDPKSDPRLTPKQNATSRYHFVDQFCLSRRIDVKVTFCLHVLRSSPTVTTVKDNKGLLIVAADLAIQFGIKTIVSLQKMAKEETKKGNLQAVNEECQSAYDGYVKQYRMLVEEAETEAQMAAFDSALARLEINKCVKAVKKSKNADIRAQNKMALDYAKLVQNIADSIQ